MYGYNEYTSLGPIDILNEVTEEEIFGIFIKKEIIADKGLATYVAPYRNDNNPDCYFEKYDGKLFFVDFADYPTSKNCFSFIERCTGLSMLEARTFIVKELNLGKGNSLKRTLPIKVEEDVEVKKIKRKRTITYLPRNFNYKDKEFWSKYKITRENLEEDGVIAISFYRSTKRNGEVFSVSLFDIAYAYTDFDGNRVKIYRPHGNSKEKWFTNCTQHDIGGFDDLPISGKQLIITKSYKDYRVLKNQGLVVVWFQNEGMLPNATLLKLLCKRFDKIVVWFDNDEPGHRASRMVVSHLNSLYPGKARKFSLGEGFLERGIKDPSDYIANEGEEQLNQLLIDNNFK